MKAVLLAVVVLVASGTAVARADDEPARPVLSVKSTPSGLSVQAQAVPLDEVLREVARVTGVSVFFEASLDPRATRRPTTLALRDAKVEDVLRRVLRDINFVVAYGPDRLEEVRIFGSGTGTGPFNRLAMAPATGGGRSRIGPPPRSVPPGPRLQDDDAAEPDAPTLEKAALSHPDPLERASALSRLSDVADETKTREVALRVLDRDQSPEVLREALNLLETQDQLPREQLMRFAAGSRPAESRVQALDMLADSGTNDAAFRGLVTTLSKDSNAEVRQRALEILEDLEGDSDDQAGASGTPR
jgi:hypothetical protein